MKKVLSLILAVMFCMLPGISAFAAEPVEAEESSCEMELYIPEGEPQFFPIPESNDPLAEDMTLDLDDAEISPLLIPSTANEFRIVSCEVRPAVLKNGEYQASDAKMTFRPKSFAPTTIKESISKEDQQKMIAYAGSKGEKVVGWYITGIFFMDCYLKHWVEYRIFSRDQNGETLKAKTVSPGTGIAEISNRFLFPNDTTKSYTFGYEGRGVMQVYDAAANTVHDLYPEYVMKVTFSNS